MEKLEAKKHAPHPSVVLILGDADTGKTVTACSLIDDYRKEGHRIVMGAPGKVVKNYPNWMKRTDPYNPQLKEGDVFYVDDAHLQFYARDWAKGKAYVLDLAARERFHTKNSFIYTTQQGRVLDINLVSMSSLLIFKAPSLLQLEVERQEVKAYFEEADEALKEHDYDVKLAYIFARRKKGLVEVEMPEWYNDKIRRAQRGFNRPSTSQSLNKHPLIEILRTIGRYG